MTPSPADAQPADAPPTAFADLAAFVALPRLGNLALSADGTRLAVAVQTLDAERKKWQSAVWEVDPEGQRPPRRLTRSAPGESSPGWAPDGTLLFTSARPDPDAAPGGDDDPKPALWALPAGGGEARRLAARPGGIGSFLVAADSGDVVVVADTMSGGSTGEDDERLRKERKDAGVTAVLHEQYPIRFWDHDLGPAAPHHFFAGPLPDEAAAGEKPEPPALRDLTPDAVAPHGAGEACALSPDGSLLVRTENVPDGPAAERSRLVLTSTADGSDRVLVDDPLATVYAAAFSPDGSAIVCVRETLATYQEPPDYTLLHVDVASGRAAEITAGFDRWPSAPQFSADGTAVYFLADDDGRHAIFRVPADGGEPIRLTGDGG